MYSAVFSSYVVDFKAKLNLVQHSLGKIFAIENGAFFLARSEILFSSNS